MARTDERRVAVIHAVAQGQFTAPAAAEVLGLSERQVRRLLAAYRQTGASALRPGNTGRPPARTITDPVRRRVVTLARTIYQRCNYQHLSELLAEREGLTLSRSSVRRILLAAGLTTLDQPAVAARQRRPRFRHAGMRVQIDASPHAWLEERGPGPVLLAAIDDATHEVPAALFRPTEDAHGYCLLLERLVTTHGRPPALYHDRHGIFQVNPKQALRLEEQLAGRPEPPQFGQQPAELEMTSSPAQSPQAKGRVERLCGPLQDRLVIALRLAGAATLAEAERARAASWPRFNARFRVPAPEGGRAYRPLATGVPPEPVFGFNYRRTVAPDNTVQVGERRVPLRPGPTRRSWGRAPVEVHHRLDSSLAVYYQGAPIATVAAPLEAPTRRARAGRRPRATPAAPAPRAQPAPATPTPAAPTPATPRRPAADHPGASLAARGQAGQRLRPPSPNPDRIAER
jgi:transposase